MAAFWSRKMKLDARIKKGKKPLTAFDELESKFIGTDCYFSDNARDYGDLSKCQIGTLLSRDGMTGVFNATKNNSYAFFEYCLPCEWVQGQKVNEGGGNRLRVEIVSHRYEGLFDEALERFVATHDCVNVNIVRYDQSQGYRAIIVYRKAIQGEKL